MKSLNFEKKTSVCQKISAAVITVVILFIAILFTGCVPDKQEGSANINTPPPETNQLAPQNQTLETQLQPAAGTNQGALITEQMLNVAQQDIGSAGGTVTITKPGDPLDGFTVDIPADSYSDARNFKVAESPIISHTFGANFNPISPLISIDNGGEYSDRLIVVKVPVKLPVGQFAMGFFYDEKDGNLEGIPLLTIEDGSVSLAMTHFSHNFVISSVPQDVLQQELSSGFTPGVDDWQFPNHGSYIAPWGFCSGQTLAAMWYYHEKPDGTDKHLYGLYDNNAGGNPGTPDLWVDDAMGYRFVSTIQVDYETNIRKGKQAVKFFSELAQLDDKITLSEYQYSMLLTGEPQYIEVWNFKSGIGHALIVYKITAEGTLLVADPNFPGNCDRKIEFAGGKFLPYNSGSDASSAQQGKGTAYDKIIYCVNTAMLPYHQITNRWLECQDGSIGHDLFPSYSVEVYDDSGHAQGLLSCNSDFTTNQKILKLGASALGKNFNITVYRDGAYLRSQDGKLELKPGNNRLGIAVWGDANQSPGVHELKWIDFEYYNVICSGG